MKDVAILPERQPARDNVDLVIAECSFIDRVANVV